MRRGFGSNGRFGGRRVGVAATVALVAGLAAGPGMLAARSATVGAIDRVSVPGSGGDRNARQEGGSSLACSALTPRRCTKRTMSDDGTKVVYSSAADNLVDGDTNGRADIFLTTLTPGTKPTEVTSAAFTIKLPTKLRIRAVLPAAQAATCYLPAKSKVIRS